jgi:hypothetical protein
MTEIKKSPFNSKNYLIVVVCIVTLIGTIIGFLNINFFKKKIEYLIYSNDFHNISCNNQPTKQELTQKFNNSKKILLEKIKQIEKENSENILEESYSIQDNVINGSYISIRLNETCEGRRSELQIFITSNDFVPKLKKIIKEELGEVPISYINN